ncbi:MULTISPECIES: flagellar motor protein [unclassified Paenibacillus]|uniref:flagellar motor protein n=1 Tax=unclassified Paenibacillus TaxID=185978 RepID=UPI001AE9D6D1|nr:MULTISPECIES: flagellar motor protein [unclassified Paenibacillus]MBP1157765.1 chemotaxis protein MotA [Paenibacillus sp. PvP091]MBP1171499.1 chemotaxis protein MotA [Paenibacillus sp. PvR098]MBP2442527.1 chemotaxis protein MotA [Paenibacillus sp. PvP052]
MDITTILGILIGIGALIGGYVWDGGHLKALFVPSAALIVFGGTIGAVVVSFPKSQLKQISSALKLAFQESKRDSSIVIEELVDMSTTARREGVLSLEQRALEHPDAFLREGLVMVVDGTDPELTKQILELEIDALENRHEGWAKIFESAGGFAPTMGIIGTVMGLIHVLGNLSDPGSLGPSIAVAFSATLYGVGSANVIYLPIASKIKIRSKETIAEMEMMLEGILALQAGENPQLIKKKLYSFLHQEQKTVEGAGEADGEEK